MTGTEFRRRVECLLSRLQLMENAIEDARTFNPGRLELQLLQQLQTDLLCFTRWAEGLLAGKEMTKPPRMFSLDRRYLM